MLKLACEIPTCQLERLVPQLDLDFILAHKVLQDEKYAKYFRNTTTRCAIGKIPWREVILDNSTHEFGKPMDAADLQSAIDLSRPDWLIAPDIVNESINSAQFLQNIEWVKSTCENIVGTQIASVLCGHSEVDRLIYLEELDKIGAKKPQMLCFTFHDSNRLKWFADFAKSDFRKDYKRIHLLGMNTFDELRKWVTLSEAHTMYDFTFDTSKPLKFGAQLLRLDKVQNLRGGPIRSKEVLDLEHLSEEQLQCIEWNIAYLKKVCRGGA